MIHSAFKDQRKIDPKCFVFLILASAVASEFVSESSFGDVHGTCASDRSLNGLQV